MMMPPMLAGLRLTGAASAGVSMLDAVWQSVRGSSSQGALENSRRPAQHTAAMQAGAAGLTSVEAAGVVPHVVDAVGGLGHEAVRLGAGGDGADVAFLGGIVPA